MFGFKKKETPVVETTPVVTAPQGPSIRNCIKCGARCSRNQSGMFRCSFCGVSFTDEEAEAVAKRKQAAMQANQNVSRQSAPAPQYTPTSQQSAYSAPVMRPTFKPESVMSNEASSEDIYADNCNGVVEIITDFGRASGLIISKKGFVLTNAHAVLDQNQNVAGRIFVKHNDQVINAQLIAIGNTDVNDPHNVDLALLKMEYVPSNAISLRLGNSSNVRIGQHVYYIGNSKGEGLCMTAGIVSDNNRKVGERNFIMTDAATNPGNSGGPLFNDDGKVIGVHVSARVEAVGMKYAIPVDSARMFLNVVEDMAGIQRNTIADNLEPAPTMGTESLSAGVVLTLVLSGVTLLVKNIEFIKEIVDTVNG